MQSLAELVRQLVIEKSAVRRQQLSERIDHVLDNINPPDCTTPKQETTH